MLPACLAPQFGPLVPAVLDEPEVTTVGDGHRVEFELRHLDDVCRALVVESPRIGGRAHLECAGGDPDAFGLADGSGARRFRRVEQRWALPQLVCREHRLVVLLFVLRDHREDETLAGQLVVECTVFEHIPGEIADSTRVTASGVGVEQRQPCAGRAGMPERVVEIVDVAADRRAPARDPHEPAFLLVGDMREIPHQRLINGECCAVRSCSGTEVSTSVRARARSR